MLSIYLSTLTHYAWFSRLQTKDIDLMHQAQFLTPDSQIRTSCSKKSLFHIRFVIYHFFALYNNHKSFKTSTIRLKRKCSKVVRISSDIFGNIGKSSENRWKSSEVAQTFSEIPVMTRQKSRVFDSEKVGRYISSNQHLFFFWQRHSLVEPLVMWINKIITKIKCPDFKTNSPN